MYFKDINRFHENSELVLSIAVRTNTSTFEVDSPRSSIDKSEV